MKIKILSVRRSFIYLFLPILLFAKPISAQNVDIDLLRDINVKRNHRLDNSFKVITNSVMPVSIGLPLGIFATGLINKDVVTRNNGIEAGAGFILASCISTGLKIIVNRPRPFVTYPDIQKMASAGSYSFPSGHTTAAFATATSISLIYPKWYVIAPAFTWACLSGYSRMHLGVHYPSDVLAGIVIGVGSSLLVHQGAKWIQTKK